MKKRIMIYCVIIMTANVFKVSAQSSAGNALALKMAKNITDSLSLSQAQQVSIYNANVTLNQQKQQIRSQHLRTDSVQLLMQKIENSRDLLYKSIINNDAKYFLYKEKKKSLITNY